MRWIARLPRRNFIGLILFVPLLFPACRPKANPGPACSVGSPAFEYIIDSWNATRTVQGKPAWHHEGRGDGTGPRALRRGLCAVAAMARPMSDHELDRVRRKYGQPPQVIVVAMEGFVVVVGADSPLRSVSMPELAQAFGTAPVDGSEIWKTLAPKSRLQPIGINSASDRYRWFKDTVLGGKDFSSRVLEVPGPLQLVDLVAETPGAIGYARPAELSAGVRALPLRVGKDTIAFSEKSAGAGSYPLARYYYLYLPPPKSKNLTPAVLDFVGFATSRKGQEALAPLGLFAPPAVEQERNKKVLAAYDALLSTKAAAK